MMNPVIYRHHSSSHFFAVFFFFQLTITFCVGLAVMIIMIPINGYIAAKTRKLQVPVLIFSFRTMFDSRLGISEATVFFINWQLVE